MTIARATATRCCCPPESSVGRWSTRSAQPDRFERRQRPRAAARPVRPARSQRQRDVVERAWSRDQVEALEDEADLAVADHGQLVFVQLPDVDAVEQVATRGRVVEAADDVHQRRLARAGRAHDRHVVAALDGQVDAGDGVHGGVTGAIGLADAASAMTGRLTARRVTDRPPPARRRARHPGRRPCAGEPLVLGRAGRGRRR